MNKIIYLDSAASYLKSDGVVQAQVDFLNNNYANAGRGICARAVAVDNMVAGARKRVAQFINATENQVVFTSGTTGAMNMIARMLITNKSMQVAVSDLDHHSARLPFQKSGAQIVVCPLDENFNIDVQRVPVADVLILTAMSNVLGVAQNVAEIICAAREKNPNVIVVVDAAQYIVHQSVDVKKWDCDFMCWSAHKIGADTGLGVMYVKNPDKFMPVNFGGGMVKAVVGDDLVLNDVPEKFEAGTLPLTQIAGLSVAIDELEKNRPNLELIKYAYDELASIPKVKIVSARDAAILSFVVDGMHMLDFGAMIGARGVCLRVGNMCASWIHRALGVDGTIRVSIGGYNTADDIKTLIQYTKDIIK